MESSGNESDDGKQKGLREEIDKALDDLQGAAVEASGAVHSQIESAVEQIKGATGSAATKAQAGAGDLSSQFDGARKWIQSATGELLDETQSALTKLQEEIEKRRKKLGLGGSGGEDEPVAESGDDTESGGSA